MMKSLYRIIDDSGVPYNFIRGFRPDTPSWLGQIVEGILHNNYGFPQITIKQPFQNSEYCTYTADPKCFEEVNDEIR